VFLEETLNLPDLNGSVDGRSGTSQLAQARRGADNSARPPEGIVFLDGSDCARDVSEAKLPNKAPGIGARRAGLAAGGVETEQASGGFFRGQREGEPPSHFICEQWCSFG